MFFVVIFFLFVFMTKESEKLSTNEPNLKFHLNAWFKFKYPLKYLPIALTDLLFWTRIVNVIRQYPLHFAIFFGCPIISHFWKVKLIEIPLCRRHFRFRFEVCILSRQQQHYENNNTQIYTNQHYINYTQNTVISNRKDWKENLSSECSISQGLVLIHCIRSAIVHLIVWCVLWR